MERHRQLTTGATLFVIGVIGILRFTAGVRSVAIVGLAGGGFALGVAFALLVPAFTSRRPPASR
jgi:hypothetical protein